MTGITIVLGRPHAARAQSALGVVWVRYTGKILSGEAQTALIESASFIWGKNVSSLPEPHP